MQLVWRAKPKEIISCVSERLAFGRVIEGMDVLAKLQRIDPSRGGGAEPDKIVKATVVRKRDHKYEPTKVK